MNILSTLTTTMIFTRLVSAAVFTILMIGGSIIKSDVVYAVGVEDNLPIGRKPVAIVDGQYPASYFPNTELLGADEMRITALGTQCHSFKKSTYSVKNSNKPHPTEQTYR